MADGPLAPSPRGRYAALPEDYVSRQAPRRSPGPGRGSGTRPGTGPRVGSEGAEARRERRAGTGGIRKEAQSRQRVVSRGSQMAPVKISHVVSFSSQDPKYPVENLLREDGLHPWLGCPQDRSRQLRVELQLERASPIGYVDIGNCGCAFLQIEVGRSSWPLDRPYLTLVPSVALMTPADSKLDQNRCGVRMFKEGGRPARGRPLVLQPCLLLDSLSRTALELEGGGAAEEPPAAAGTRRPEPSPPQPPGPDGAVGGAEPGPEAQSRHRHPGGGDAQLPAEDPGGSAVPGSAQDVPAAPARARRQPDSRQRAPSPAGRSLPAASRQSRSGGRARARSHRERRARRGDSGGDSGHGETGVCPICSGRFSLDLLPAHASRCGEEDPGAAWPSSSLAEASPDAWVSCPICELPFGAAEVERHASTCGEQAGTPGTLG
ncbi:protein XNDC1N isoform X5 [Calonectris borealis]|uniref:protein XNDC1N isoform X5 n=1 Tax=Calonectris borealis TaxID=1323832 RepID=UPI003F4C8E42